MKTEKKLCRIFLNKYGDQAELGKHMLGCIEREVCNISCRHPNQKIKINNWYTKRDSPMGIADGYERMNMHVSRIW